MLACLRVPQKKFFPVFFFQFSISASGTVLVDFILDMDRNREKNKSKKRGRPNANIFGDEKASSSSQNTKSAQAGYEVVPGADHISPASDVRI